MNLREALNTGRTIILDGAMGTQLEKHGLQGACDVNLTHPEKVLEIHCNYFRAGSHAVITNTLLLNALSPSRCASGVSVDAANRAGVRLAKEAAASVRPDGIVLGNIGTTGKILEPYGDATEAEIIPAFLEQAEILADEGVDGLIIETMTDLREAICALQACKRVAGNLPVLVSLVFQAHVPGFKTSMGNASKDAAARLKEEGADAVGANCGIGLAPVIADLHSHTSLPLLVEPNAGIATLQGDHTVFPMDPQAFAADLRKCHQAGARLIGGCCGTTPGHIKAVSDLF